MLHPTGGPYALCWINYSLPVAFSARLPCTTLEEALEAARCAARDYDWRAFWLRAWEEEPPVAYDVAGQPYCIPCGDSGSGPCAYHAKRSGGTWAALLRARDD